MTVIQYIIIYKLLGHFQNDRNIYRLRQFFFFLSYVFCSDFMNKEGRERERE